MKDLSAKILNVETVIPRSLKPGTVLVAAPSLNELYFSHSAVMLVDFEKGDGALGLVLNLRSGHNLNEYLDGVSPEAEVPVYCGGPIAQDRMVFMHTLGPDVFPGSKEFAPGLYLGGDFEAAINYVNSGYPVEGFIRFFIGHSGWADNQLFEEMNDGVWAVAEPGENKGLLLSGSDDAYWHRCVRGMGHHYRAWQFFPRNVYAN